MVNKEATSVFYMINNFPVQIFRYGRATLTPAKETPCRNKRSRYIICAVQEGDDEVGDYKLRDDNYPEQDDSKVMPHRVETSFNEMLLEQLGHLNLDERLQPIAEQVVGSIDDDGYLRRDISSIVDDLAFRQNIITTEEEIAKIILQIQQFDPPGIGARNLQGDRRNRPPF